MVDNWTEQEIGKFTNRVKKLQKIGMDEVGAELLAVEIMVRDRENNIQKMHLCLECKNWRNKCTHQNSKEFCQIPIILQRCNGFEGFNK